MKKYIITILLIMTAVLPSVALPKELILLDELSAGLVLEDGKGYYFNSTDLTLRAPAGVDALRVAPGATAYLYINVDQKLHLYGGNASFTTAAGAGIRVEKGSKLCIVGYGTIEAYGGNGGIGTKGEAGQDGQFDDDDYFAGGYGGAGGNGGGGAAAGIGGRGGNGGHGTPREIGMGWRDVSPRTNLYDGTTGRAADYGGNGGDMGEIYVIGNSTIKAYPGKANVAIFKDVEASGKTEYHNFNSIFGNDYYAGGGGAGGNGASGYRAPWGIGGGAPGASGAGAGASGAIFDIYHFDFIHVLRFFSQYKVFKKLGEFAQEKVAGMILQKAYDLIGQLTNMDQWDLNGNDISGSVGLGAYNQADGLRYPASNFNNVERKQFERRVPILGPLGIFEVLPCPGSPCGDPGRQGALGNVYSYMRPSIMNADSIGNLMPSAHEMFKDIDKIPDDLRQGVATTIVFSNDSVARGGNFGDDNTNVLTTCIGDKLPTLALNSDNTPLHVLDAEHPETPLYTFGGYADKQGKRWYDENGKPINNIEGVMDALMPVILYPVWNNNFYCIVSHEKQSLENDNAYTPFDYELHHASYVLHDNPGIVLDNLTFSLHALDGKDELKGYQPVVRDTTVVYDKAQYADKYQPHVVSIRYVRKQAIVRWNLPAGTYIMDSDEPESPYYHPYTKEGSILKYGQSIVAPMYIAVVNADAHGAYTIDHWTRSDGAKGAATFTMPETDVVMSPVLSEATISIYANSPHGEVSTFEAKANTNQTVTIKPDEGWEVDKERGIMLTHYFHDQSGTLHSTTHAVYELAGTPDTYVIPVRGEAMEAHVPYVGKKVNMTLKQPMAGNVREARTMVRSNMKARPIEIIHESEGISVSANNKVRILVEPESADECLDSASVKIVAADGTNIPFSIIFEPDTIGQEKSIITRGGIEFKTPVTDFTAEYKLRTVDTNTIHINTQPGVGAMLGKLTDTEMQEVITGRNGNTSYTNDAIFGNDILYIEFTDSMFVDIYKIGRGGKQEKFDGRVNEFSRTKGKKGYAILIPADASGQEYCVNASYDRPVAYLYSEKDGGGEEHQIIYRKHNDITLNGNWSWNHFMVGNNCVAKPFSKDNPDAKLHINLTYEKRDKGYTPFVVPFTFVLDEETNAKCGFAVPSDVAEDKDGNIDIFYLTKLEVGDTIYANYGYYMNPRVAGQLSLDLYTDQWEQTRPQTVEYKTAGKGQFIQHIPTYDYILLNSLYTESVTPLVIGKGRALYVTDKTAKYHMNPLGAYFLTNGNPLKIDFKVIDSYSDDAEDIPVADGIAEIYSNKTCGSNRIYDIMGRQINNTAVKPGLYITNGRKVVIK